CGVIQVSSISGGASISSGRVEWTISLSLRFNACSSSVGAPPPPPALAPPPPPNPRPPARFPSRGPHTCPPPPVAAAADPAASNQCPLRRSRQHRARSGFGLRPLDPHHPRRRPAVDFIPNLPRQSNLPHEPVMKLLRWDQLLHLQDIGAEQNLVPSVFPKEM